MGKDKENDFKTSVLWLSCVSTSIQINLKVLNGVFDYIDSLSNGFIVIDTQIETITGF